MTPDERDRLTRLETKLDYIIEGIKHPITNVETLQRLTALEAHRASINEKIAYVSGAFAIVISLGVWMLKWIVEQLTIGWGK